MDDFWKGFIAVVTVVSIIVGSILYSQHMRENFIREMAGKGLCNVGIMWGPCH